MSTEHWDRVYREKGEDQVSWFDPSASAPVALLDALALPTTTAVLDMGGGASRFVDALLARGFTDVTVLDLADDALAIAKTRLGEQAAKVRWIVGDATRWSPDARYGFWHDRAVFHFLTEQAQRDAYVERLHRAVTPGGLVAISTFAPDGPERCSGLPVQRHDAQSLSAALGDEFVLVEERRHDHATPWGAIQKFQTSLFRRRTA